MKYTQIEAFCLRKLFFRVTPPSMRRRRYALTSHPNKLYINTLRDALEFGIMTYS